MDSESEKIFASLTKKKGKETSKYVSWYRNNSEDVDFVREKISLLFGGVKIDENNFAEILYKLRCVHFDLSRICFS